jgi:hypothetical protein
LDAAALVIRFGNRCNCLPDALPDLSFVTIGMVSELSSDVGTAGVPPATRRKARIPGRALKLFSRCALIAGGTPAVPAHHLIVMSE